MKIKIFLIHLSIFIFSTQAAETANECDKLTAHPKDENNLSGVVVSWSDLDPIPAIEACKKIVVIQPDNFS